MTTDNPDSNARGASNFPGRLANNSMWCITSPTKLLLKGLVLQADSFYTIASEAKLDGSDVLYCEVMLESDARSGYKCDG